MTLHFPALPRRATTAICSFLNYRSLSRLREVSKSVKDVVDGSILNVVFTAVSKFEVAESSSGEVEIRFHFTFPQSSVLWKICLTRLSMKIGFHFHDSRLFQTATMQSTQLKFFFEHLKPLTAKAIFHSVEVPIEEELFSAFSYFLQCQSIREVWISEVAAENKDFRSWLNLIKSVKPTTLRYYPHAFNKDVIDFLESAAEIVVCMHPNLFKCCPIQPNGSVVSLVRNILSRKCEQLYLKYPISLEDAEQLIKYFHQQSEKKIILEAVTGMRMRGVQIGMYKVTYDTLKIKIKHVEAQPLPDQYSY